MSAVRALSDISSVLGNNVCYERKPAGLKGALENLGLLFKGRLREHSGVIILYSCCYC